MQNRGMLLVIVASLGFSAFGCAGAAELPPPSTPIVTNPTIPETQAASSTPTEATPQAAPVAQAAQTAPTGTLFCSATADGNTREVYLDWKGDKGSGTLRTTTSGVVKDEPVKAERTKAKVVLADSAAKAKATIVLKGDAKKIQVGDTKQPWTSCR
jgi:hypothetical protein